MGRVFGLKFITFVNICITVFGLVYKLCPHLEAKIHFIKLLSHSAGKGERAGVEGWVKREEVSSSIPSENLSLMT